MIGKRLVTFGVLTLTVFAALLLIATRPAHAQTETVLYSFGSYAGDGTDPFFVNPTFDKKGNLYGTTLLGGAYGSGTVFQLSRAGKSWTEKVIYSFGSQPGDGQQPVSGLTFDKTGNLYGTTQYGGANGGGTVFKLTP